MENRIVLIAANRQDSAVEDQAFSFNPLVIRRTRSRPSCRMVGVVS